MKAVCVDFETANRFHGSICAVGITVQEEGKITFQKYWLVKPHKRHFYFDDCCVMVHGITKADVMNAPEFNQVYGEIKPLLENSVLVAHNAAFDMSALRYTLDLYKIPYPEINYICTYKMAKKMWRGFENYRLNTVCQHLNYKFKHHHALEDATACAHILWTIMQENGIFSIESLASYANLRIGKLYKDGYVSCSAIREAKKQGDQYSGYKISDIVATTDSFDEDHEFFCKKIIFTGTLLSMTRKEAMQKVVDVGGQIGNSVTDDTDFVVMGFQDYSRFTDGKESSKTKKAKELISKGIQIQIIDEDDFLKFI